MADVGNLFDAIAGVLVGQPGSSMQEIAGAGVSQATLPRVCGYRGAQVERVSRHMLADCEELFDEAGIDEAPVLEAFAAHAAPLRLGEA